MSSFSRLRIYHAGLALLATAAYVSEDAERLHIWLGYGLAAVVAARVVVAFIAPRVLNKPNWLITLSDMTLVNGLRSPLIGKAILLAIMASLLVTLGTGIALEQKALFQVGNAVLTSPAHADEKYSERKRNKPSKLLKETHETAANGLFLLVVMHVAYLLVMRRQYALAMVFLGRFGKTRL